MSLFITDGNHRATLAVVRALGRAGIKVTVGQQESSSIAGRSRYCAAAVRYPSPLTGGQAFKAFLRDEMRSGRYSILLPMTDITTNYVAEDAAELRQFVHLPLPDLARIRKAQDKRETLALAQRLGIACPATVAAANGGAIEEALETLSFPMVLKPRFSRVFQGAWRYGQVQYANDRDELISKYQAAHSEIPSPLIQEKIEGEGCGMFLLLWNGELKAAFAHLRLREKPPSGGVSVCCKSIPLDATLLEKSYLLLRQIGWHGPAMVEFKVDDRDGQPKFIEVNGRFWGSLQLAIDAGLNFPLLLYRLALGESVPFSADYRIGVKNRWLLGDLDHLLMRLRTPRDIDSSLFPNKSKIGAVIEFLRFYERDLYYSDLRYDDLKPFLLECKRYLGKVYGKAPVSWRDSEPITNEQRIAVAKTGQ